MSKKFAKTIKSTWPMCCEMAASAARRALRLLVLISVAWRQSMIRVISATGKCSSR